MSQPIILLIYAFVHFLSVMSLVIMLHNLSYRSNYRAAVTIFAILPPCIHETLFPAHWLSTATLMHTRWACPQTSPRFLRSAERLWLFHARNGSLKHRCTLMLGRLGFKTNRIPDSRSLSLPILTPFSRVSCPEVDFSDQDIAPHTFLSCDSCVVIWSDRISRLPCLLSLSRVII